jgi:hypothetical protein
VTTQTIKLGYEARKPFRPFHTRKQRFGCIVAHRRAGKTVASILDLIDAALRCDKPDPRFAYIAPYYAQAKDVVWAYVKRFTGQIPGAQINESELRVDFPHNGARLRLYGADNYDRLRGIYLDGVVLDEFADQPPQAWREVIRPALADRQGWAVFIGTPKGRNAFYDVYQSALTSDEWFALKLKASETGLVEQSELDAMRAQMTANEYNREMECDFDAAIEGAYYADEIAKARAEGRIGLVAEDPHLIVRLYADIGGTGAKADNFVFWAAQHVGTEIRWTNHYEVQGQPIAAHLAWLRSQGYSPDRAAIWLPHDGDTQDKVFDVSYRSALEAAGYTVHVIPNQGKGAAINRIEKGRHLFGRMRFDEARTKAGVDALVAYHEKRDEKRGIGLGPAHDWASHSADAFGAGCVAYEEPQAAVKLDFGSGGGWGG